MPTTMQPMRIKHIERLKNKVLMEHCILLKFLQPKIPVCFDLFSSFQQFRYINFIFFKEMPMIWIRTVDRSLLDTTALPNVPQLLPYTVQFCSKKFPIKCNKITREHFRGKFSAVFRFRRFSVPRWRHWRQIKRSRQRASEWERDWEKETKKVWEVVEMIKDREYKWVNENDIGRETQNGAKERVLLFVWEKYIPTERERERYGKRERESKRLNDNNRECKREREREKDKYYCEWPEREREREREIQSIFLYALVQS